jgi:hypothetical protein
MMNPEAKEWLEEQMVNKHKWANAFDEGGWSYGVNNTNLLEVLNKVLKGIRACQYRLLWSTLSTRSIHILCIGGKNQKTT